jgi:hypothetical protein
MRKLLLISAVLTLAASSALAAPSIGVYFDQGMANSDGTVEPFVNSTMYVIVSGIDGAAEGAEYDLTLPPNVAVLGHNYAGGNGWALQGSGVSYAIAFGGCELIGDLAGYTPSFIVDEIAFMTIAEFNQTPVTLEACTACGDDIGVTSPRYASCFETVHNLTPTAGSIASQTVPVQSESFAAVKALFAN